MRFGILFVLLLLCACGTTSGEADSGASDDGGLTWDTSVPGFDTLPDAPPVDTPEPDVGLELGLPDTPPDTDTACEPGEGCFLEPCDEDADCASGFCVEEVGEEVCTQTCTGECPDGWSCQPADETSPDGVFICVSDLANLCRPCWSDAQCVSAGGATDICVLYGPGAGAFCGGDCLEDGDCPDGYSCADAVAVDGASTKQCVHDLGECPCTETSTAGGLWTPCTSENDIGSCAGKRTCGETGLSECDAAQPVTEECNGKDDDCDELTDEDTCDDGNICTDDFCQGFPGCEHLLLNGNECDDGDGCTAGDHCIGGQCIGQLTDCDDGNACTADGCAEGKCFHNAIDTTCDDGDECTSGDHCEEGACVTTGTLDCDDANPCTDDVCDPGLGCQYTPVDASCSDGDPCSEEDHCEGGICVGIGGGDCDDGDPCTMDACDLQGGCIHTPIVPCCGNGIIEGPGEECDDGNQAGGDGCDASCQIQEGPCFQDWLVGTPCNGVDYGNGCVPSDTGYHFKGIYSGYACWWHHKNQAWNTTQETNYYHLAQHFGVTPGTGKVSWCHDKNSTPTPASYSSNSSYFSISNVGAWGWCAESDPNSVGFVCIPQEGYQACS